MNKPDVKPLENRASNLKELELNALLEVTEAINNNLSEETLYKIYHFTLLANLKIKKLALFVLDEENWTCKVSFGVKQQTCTTIELGHYLDLTASMPLAKDHRHTTECFDFVIPVLHKNILLALMFVGDVAIEQSGFSSKSATTFLEALTNIILVAIQNKKLARQQLVQEAMKKELEIAQQVQQYLFPKSLPQTNQLEIDAFYQPHHNVGGDYYDYIAIDKNQWLVCIADVSGKGIPAALMMSNFQASLHTLVRQTDDLEKIVTELNYQTRLNGNGDIFITFFVAIYHFQTHCLKYVNCGHNPPLMIQNKQTIEELKIGTTILGIFHPLPFLKIGLLENIKEFTLFCYTDGLNETINKEEEEFGENQILEIATASFGDRPGVLNTKMMQTVNDFRQNQDYRDDVTILSIKLKL